MPKSKHLLVVCVGIVILACLALVLVLRDDAKLIPASTLEAAIQKNAVKKAWIRDDYVYVQANDDKTYKALLPQINQDILKSIPIQKSSSYGIWLILGGIFIVVFVAVYVIFRFQKPNIQITPLNAKKQAPPSSPSSSSLESRITPITSHIHFSDVAGIYEAKEELLEIVDFLKNPSKYRSLGITLPKGVLLSGAPGVGKTLIAKALAGESGVPFYYQSGASFVEMYVGVGAKRVRELFSAAKANAPSIIFIDEIDAIGKKRMLDSNNNERESTLNQLLTEMDGFSDNTGVIVIAATNHIEVLDSALLRSGRFDRKVFIELPNLIEREEILKVYLANKPHHIDIQNIAKKTSGFSGAMLATLVNEAALIALKRDSQTLQESDFESVYSKILSGKRRLPFLDESMRKVYALYQASKIYYALSHKLVLEKATLFETTLIDSNFAMISTKQLEEMICFYIVGNEANIYYFNQSYGVFRQDFLESKALLASGVDGGLLEDSSKCLTQAKKEAREFVIQQAVYIAIIAGILLTDERFDWNSIDIQALLASGFLDSSDKAIQEIRALIATKANI